jgi:hypothetical protein
MTARHGTLVKRMRRATARRARRSIPHLATLVAVPLVLLLPISAIAQSATQGTTISAPGLEATGLGIFGGSSPKTTSASPGTASSEILRGNGSRIGYKLSRGNLITDTVRVRAGGRQLVLDRDFWVDPASGSLIFADAVRSTDSISVYYRYLDGPAAASSSMGMPALMLNFGGASLGLSYNSLAGDGSGLDTSLFGLALGGKVGGSGLAQFNGMAYFSQTQASNNVVNSLAPSGDAPKPKTDAQVGVGHLITQSFAVNSGKLQFHADYQDVDKKFAGFQALKAGNANNKAMLDQLTALENEKGVKRLGFGASIANDLKSKTPNGLDLQWNRIEDGKGAISQEAIGYSNRSLHFNYASRDVASTFASFKGLREADKTQWEREKGLKTTTLGLGLNFGANKKGETTGGLDFTSQSFKDKTGTLSRDIVSLNSGGLGFALMNRRSDAGFKRLNDLSDADKTLLALDLYHEFDPTAKAQQVTAADRAQVVKEAGLARSALRVDDSLGKAGQLSYSQLHVSNTSPSTAAATAPAQPQTLERESFGVATGQFALNYTSRRADAGFNRLGDLADVEKNNLVLDTRRMFDPAAKIEQVTQKDRDQLAKEAGIERTNLRGQMQFGKAGKLGELNFSSFHISDRPAVARTDGLSDAVDGALLGYKDRTLQLSFMRQSIGSGFNRLADLSDIDRVQFGNARGLSQQALTGAWQLNKTTKLSFSSVDVGGTHDAVLGAQADAIKNSRDAALAAKTAASGVRRISAAFETPGLSFSAGQATTDREFARSADLPLPAADKAQIETERGTSRSNYALHFAKIKGLTLDGNLYDAVDAEQKRDHKVDKVNAQFAPTKSTNLTFLTDTDMTTLVGKKTGTDHTALTLNQQIGKNFLVNLVHDSNAVYDNDTPTPQSARTDAFRLETTKAKPNNLNFDVKRIAYLDGRYENSTNLIVHAKPTAALTFNYSRQEIDRGQGAPEAGAPPTTTPATTPVVQLPSESTDSFDGQWQATKQFAIVFGFSQKETSDNSNSGDTVSVGITGDPIKNVKMTAKFDEVHTDGKNTKDVADFAFSNAKPFKVGCINDLTLTAHYASLNDQRKLQNETMTGRASWKIWKNEFLLDYGGLTTQNGQTTISRIYSFTTDPNPKKWFHGGFYYKSRTMVDGTERLIRRFTADWRLSRRTSFTYTFGTLPEDDKGNITPQIKADISLKHAVRSDLAFEGFYRMFKDDNTKKLTRSLGFGIDGKLNRTTKLALAYSIDANGDVALYDHSNHYHFLLDHQIDADHFLTLSTDIRSHDGKDLKDDIRANVDFRVVF